MKDKEALDIMQTIEGAYPNFMNGNDAVIKQRIKVWRKRLLTWDYEKTHEKLMKHIETDKFPPTIAQLKPYESEFEDIMLKLKGVYE